MSEYDEIIDKIKSQKFYIYGAGSYGIKFEKIITKMGVKDNFMGYVVTKRKNNEDLSIKEITEVEHTNLIIIASHYVNSKEMEQMLHKLNFKNYILAFPYMTELYFGLPYKTGVAVNPKEIVKEYININYHVVLYLAIDSIIKNTEIGKQLYIKMMMMYSKKETALYKLEQLEKRVENYKSGKIENYNIQISENCKMIMDGSHRTMLAYYFDISKVYADLYCVKKEDIEEYYHPSVHEDNCFYKLFSKDEIKLLENVKRNIMGSEYERIYMYFKM